jgi:hypothetical protein
MRPNRYPLVEPRPIKSLSYLLSHSSVGATRVDSSLGYDSTILSRGPCRTNSDASWTWLMMYPILSHKVLYSRPHTLARPVPLASLSTLRVPVCMLLLQCQTQTERSESTEHSANKAVSVPSTARKSHRPSVCPCRTVPELRRATPSFKYLVCFTDYICTICSNLYQV